ncbi:MAG: DUF1800 family protein [Sphingomonadaceae bacterium]
MDSERRELAALDESVVLAPLPQPAPVAEAGLLLPPVAIVPVLALGVAACGGGGAPTGSAPPTPPAPPPPPVITGASAGRILAQGTMGATLPEIESVKSLGFAGWVGDQLARPRATTFWDWLVAGGYNVTANRDNTTGFDPAVWKQLVSSQDQLRQRVGMALLETLVVGIDGINLSWRQFAMAAYMDILWDNAFGNYRDILDKISTNAAMGSFLTFLGNRKANASSGSVPDENYARELLQLFTLGLYQLNPDGTQKLTGGNPTETYTQADITGLARVFTGWVVNGSNNDTPDRYRLPMIQDAGRHELGVKTFLGTTIAAGTNGADSLKAALDTIFAHPNTAPFVSRQLIQRLVTSNPSPAYVGRVAAVFANDGAGVRGDMKAIIRAILLDSEARNDTAAQSSTSFGKLREPIMRMTSWARAFGATSPSDAWPIGDTSSSSNRLAQSPGRSASVFNFFRPGYTPPNTAIANANLVAPEFQITNEPSVVAYLNYMQSLMVNGAGDFKADYTSILTKAADSQALLDEVNLVLAANQVSAATIAQIKTAVDSIATATPANLLSRVYTAILLIMASPEYISLK